MDNNNLIAFLAVQMGVLFVIILYFACNYSYWLLLFVLGLGIPKELYSNNRVDKTQ